MALSIKNAETERLARAVAKEAGESITRAIDTALRERLRRLHQQRRSHFTDEKIEEILQRVDKLPRLDKRFPDEILGYS
jgi:antitoxin VapB